MKKIIFIFILAAFGHQLVYSQLLDFPVINEETTIRLVGNDGGKILYSIDKKVLYDLSSCHLKNNQISINIPDVFDPTYIAHTSKYCKRRDIYDELDILDVNIYSISKSGLKTKVEKKIKIEYLKQIHRSKLTRGIYGKHIYSFSALEETDKLEVNYVYRFDYTRNFLAINSLRLFFHGSQQKDNFTLRIIHPEKIHIELTEYNNAKQDSTYTKDKTTYHIWKYKDLKASIGEVNSYPYKTLPYIVFTVKSSALLYREYNSSNVEYVPFYALYMNNLFPKNSSFHMSMSQGVKNKKYNTFYELGAKMAERFPNDPTNYNKLMVMQSDIVNSFTYSNDSDLFTDYSGNEVNVAEKLVSKEIGESYKYELYSKIVLGLEIDYLSIFAADKRSGMIDNNYFAPMYDNNSFIGPITKDNMLHYIYPQIDDFAYYIDEYPFYYEGAPAMAIHYLDYFNGDKQILTKEPKIVILPSSNFKENTRRSSAIVTINTDSLGCSFKSKVDLSGQFSTMTRYIYLNKIHNDLVNEKYSIPIWGDINNVSDLKYSAKIKTKEFPFSFTALADWKNPACVSVSDTIVNIDMTNWFAHIITELIDISSRQLDYYSDFSSKDTYTYILKFDRPIELVDSFKTINYSNQFADYTFDIAIIQEDMIRVTSYYYVKAEKVAPKDCNQINEIFQQINNSNNYNLKVKLL